jgi:uncharacterized membrane protein
MDIFSIEGWYVLLRWFHVLAGITWIGMLYYFNFVQTPFFATELGGQARSAMVRGLVPSALWWFRWGAMITFLTGWLIVFTKLHEGTGLGGSYMTLILTGGLLGTLMWANVWFVIWPAQQVVIANATRVAAGGEADPTAAARGARAGVASRTNTLFSIPMLLFMVSAANFQRLAAGADTGQGSLAAYWVGALVLILAVEANIFAGSAGTQKPLSTVSGTLHAGFVLAIVLYLLMAVML